MMITKLFTKFHCNVVITERLRSIFISKLYRMGKCFHSFGGQGRSKLLNKWGTTNWTITLNENEIVSNTTKKSEKIQ